MPALSVESIPWLFVFIVPGFVWFQVHTLLQAARPETRQSVFAALTLSAVNFAIWSWLIPRILLDTREAFNAVSTNEEYTRGWLLSIEWALIIFISPVALGTITGVIQRKEVVRDWVQAHLHILIPTGPYEAWDHAFSREDSYWVTVFTKDGEIIDGIYGDRSRASAKPSSRDLFLENQWEIEDGKYRLKEHTEGVWLAADTIDRVEFQRLIKKSQATEGEFNG